MPLTTPGCSKPHPCHPWVFPGMEQPQPLRSKQLLSCQLVFEGNHILAKCLHKGLIFCTRLGWALLHPAVLLERAHSGTFLLRDHTGSGASLPLPELLPLPVPWLSQLPHVLWAASWAALPALPCQPGPAPALFQSH